MRKILSVMLSMALAAGACSTAVAEPAVDLASADDAQAIVEEDVEYIEIATAEDLAAVASDLAGAYVLTADIDLEGAEWTPLGSFVSAGEGEEAEMPDYEYAFTGIFDGNGHTISNFTIDQPQGYALGLFGCAAEALVINLTVENATVNGGPMSAAVVGYAFMSEIDNVTLAGDNTVTLNAVEEFGDEGMVGGIVAAGMGSMIVDCTATANIVVADGNANAGIVGGGLESTSVIGCIASGTVTAGDDCYGLGGVSGCGFGAEEFTDCKAVDVVITSGENCAWVGGIAGYAGGYEDEAFGIPVTEFTGCSTENVEFDLGEGSEEPGEIVGAGFYSEEAAQMLGDPFTAPSMFVINE